MTELFQHDIQTLMPMILVGLGQRGIHYQDVLSIASPSELRGVLTQSRMLPVIEGLADSYGLSPMTWEFIVLHELQFGLPSYPEVGVLPSLEACNDPAFEISIHNF